MAGTVYPYSYQDMPIRGIPDGVSYHMFTRRPSIPFFTQAQRPGDAVPGRTIGQQPRRGAHLTMSLARPSRM
ncbi:MAG TPA: hypothetical protein PLZ20_14685 [Nitrospira sp.]|nr:hypothetical protein [Nitrospira sp.]HNK15812.1 hypothetical protein [Nitrospira sp.]